MTQGIREDCIEAVLPLESWGLFILPADPTQENKEHTTDFNVIHYHSET